MARFHQRARKDGSIERIPFTPEEEAQRDAEEAAWEAGRAAREAAQAREAANAARLAELRAKVRSGQRLTTAERAEVTELLLL